MLSSGSFGYTGFIVHYKKGVLFVHLTDDDDKAERTDGV